MRPGWSVATQRPRGISARRYTHELLVQPVATISSHTAALIAINESETTLPPEDRSPPYGVRAWRVSRWPWATQSGHWKPTEASRMQSGQIGLPHRWHVM